MSFGNVTNTDFDWQNSSGNSSFYSPLQGPTNHSMAATQLPPDIVPYCTGYWWKTFHESIRTMHGFWSITVCFYGALANVINILVFSRRPMISPTNVILCVLAITDLLVILEYIPYTIHQFLWKDRPIEQRFSWKWALFIMFHAHFTQVFHTISICLTIILAIWRYVCVAWPQNRDRFCSIKRTKDAIAISFAVSIVCNIPNYVNLKIEEKNYKNITVYVVDFSDLALSQNELLKILNFWIYSVLFKLLPCVALTLLSAALIKELLKAAKRRSVLMGRSCKGVEAERQADKTTVMLVAILLMFLISEVPQGIIGLLVILPNIDFLPCYIKFGEIMDLLVLTNSAVNFLLYYAMSQQFRNNLSQMCKSKNYKVNRKSGSSKRIVTHL